MIYCKTPNPLMHHTRSHHTEMQEHESGRGEHMAMEEDFIRPPSPESESHTGALRAATRAEPNLIAALRTANATLGTANATLRTRNATLRTANATLQAANATLQEANATLQTGNTTLWMRNVTLRTDMAAAAAVHNAQVAANHDTIDGIRRELHNALFRIQTLEAQSEATNSEAD